MSVDKENTKYDVDRGQAWVVLVAVYSLVIFHCTTLYMNGLYLAVLAEHNHDGLTKISMIGALNSALLCLLGPVVSVFMDIYSCRTCIVFGGFLLSISYFTSFFIKSINVYIFTIGIIGGTGNSFAAIPQSVILSYHFEKCRNLILSFKEVLIGVGIFIASPILLWFLDKFGLNGSFLIVCGMTLHICVGGLICAPNSEERKLMKTKCKNQTENNEASFKVFLQNVKSSAMLSLRLFKNGSLILFLLSTLAWNFAFSAFSLYLPRYMLTKGFGNMAVVTVMTVFGLCNTLGRLCAATTVGKGGLDSNILHIGMLGVLSLSAVLFPLYGRWSSAGFVLAALTGVYSGGPNALMTPITISLVGIDKLSSALGLAYFFSGVGVLTGPLFLGVMYSLTGSYDQSIMTIGFVVLLGVFCSLVAFNGKYSGKYPEIEIVENSKLI
ncbi:monocarboxylate transporter 9-like isoform X2 [Mercenaria mercenaria]|nr:monocarboxylate transporter 9-like isoform X2 [Mercenaria mercenaria]XP_053402337.1 monocarboxylate transporter 9-like isoform X2 [Mercenaria mercenaria]XP_053402338.1 monocarboxylate transporter 9-like isoform X2 [Mercenaria mercenaria]